MHCHRWCELLQVKQYKGAIMSVEGKALVNDLHAVYRAALLDLYNEHKDKYHVGRKQELQIVA